MKIKVLIKSGKSYVFEVKPDAREQLLSAFILSPLWAANLAAARIVREGFVSDPIDGVTYHHPPHTIDLVKVMEEKPGQTS